VSIAQLKPLKPVSEPRVHRGRPRSAEKTVAVLEAACDLFLEKGYAGTSMDHVARKAGVSKQTVYSHFSSKEQLFSASIRHKLDDYLADRDLDQLESHTLEYDLQVMGEVYAGLVFNADSIAMYRLLAASTETSPTLAQLYWDAGPQELMDRLHRFFLSWQERGALKFDSPGQAAIDFMSLIKGGIQFKLVIGVIDPLTEEDIKAHVARCVGTFLKIYA